MLGIRAGRKWTAVIAGVVVVTVVGGVILPRLLDPPAMEQWIYQQLGTQMFDALTGPQLEEQIAAQQLVSNLTVAQFVEMNAARLSELRAGDTFIPTWKMPSGVNAVRYVTTPAGEAYQAMALSVLQFEVEKLGVTQIRLGIRWADTISPSGQFSLAVYRPYLNFLTQYQGASGRRVQVLLGVGPMKSPGWPESFVPVADEYSATANTEFIPQGGLPGVGSVIGPGANNADLISCAENWLNTLMWRVSYQYPSINYFQLDNEPLNPAGTQHWTMSPGLEQQLAGIVLRYKPEANFLVNWTGTANLVAVSSFKGSTKIGEALKLARVFAHHSVISEMLQMRSAILKEIRAEDGRGNVTLGVDSYHLTPNTPTLPIKVQIQGHSYYLRPDSLALIDIVEKLAGYQHPWRYLRRLGVPLEITELQASPWAPYTAPGNNPKELMFELERVLQILPQNKPSVVRFWTLSNVVYNLMYNAKDFSYPGNPISMRDPTGKFIANNEAELELVTAISGVSPITTKAGLTTVDFSPIASVITQELVSQEAKTVLLSQHATAKSQRSN